jgi:hypothetical protein
MGPGEGELAHTCVFSGDFRTFLGSTLGNTGRFLLRSSFAVSSLAADCSYFWCLSLSRWFSRILLSWSVASPVFEGAGVSSVTRLLFDSVIQRSIPCCLLRLATSILFIGSPLNDLADGVAGFIFVRKRQLWLKRPESADPLRTTLVLLTRASCRTGSAHPRAGGHSCTCAKEAACHTPPLSQ